MWLRDRVGKAVLSKILGQQSSLMPLSLLLLRVDWDCLRAKMDKLLQTSTKF